MSVFIPIPKKCKAKECSNYCTIALTSHTRQSNAQNSPNEASTVSEQRTTKMFKQGLEKAKEPAIKLPAST